MESAVQCSLLGFLEPLSNTSAATGPAKGSAKGVCFLNLLLSLLLLGEVPGNGEGSVLANGSSSGSRDSESGRIPASSGKLPRGLSDASFQESKDLEYLLSPVLVSFREIPEGLLPCGGEGSADVTFGVGEVPGPGKINEDHFPELHQLLQGQIVSWLRSMGATDEKTFEASQVAVAEDSTNIIAVPPAACKSGAEMLTFLLPREPQTGKETLGEGTDSTNWNKFLLQQTNGEPIGEVLVRSGQGSNRGEGLIDLRSHQQGPSQNFSAKEVVTCEKLGEAEFIRSGSTSAEVVRGEWKEPVMLRDVVKGEGGETQVGPRSPAVPVQVLESFSQHHGEIHSIQQVQLSVSEDGSGEALTARIFEEVVARLNLHQSEGTSKVVLKLKPGFLGKLEVLVTIEKGVLHTKFIVENPAVAHLIENRLPELQNSLQDHRGACWQRVSVDVDCQGSLQGFSQPSADHQENVPALLPNFKYSNTRAFSSDAVVREDTPFFGGEVGVINYLV